MLWVGSAWRVCSWKFLEPTLDTQCGTLGRCQVELPGGQVRSRCSGSCLGVTFPFGCSSPVPCLADPLQDLTGSLLLLEQSPDSRQWTDLGGGVSVTVLQAGAHAHFLPCCSAGPATAAPNGHSLLCHSVVSGRSARPPNPGSGLASEQRPLWPPWWSQVLPQDRVSH